MDIKKNTLDNARISLEITLSESEWEAHKKNALANLCKVVKIDGFRKGHVPESVVKKHIGDAGIAEEAMEKALHESIWKAVDAEKLNPISRPEVELLKAEPLSFKVEFDVYPEVKVKKMDYTKFKMEKPEVSEEEVQQFLKMFQEELAEKKAVEKPAENGHTVVIDFDGTDLDGVRQDGMKSEGHPLELGSNMFIPGFEEKLVGMKAGEEKIFEITFPADYHAKKYAGNPFRFTVKVHEVLEKSLPEVNEEFVERLTGTKKSVEELQNEIVESVQMRKENEAFADAQEKLFEAIAEHTESLVPSIFMKEELEEMIDNVKMQGLRAGITWEKHLENLKKTEDELKDEMKDAAKKRILGRLGLQVLMEEEKIAVDHADVHLEIDRIVARSPEKDRAKVRAEFAHGTGKEAQVEDRLKIRKFFEQKLKG